MITDFRINGHPKPKTDESFRGYLLRLVDLNGFKGIQFIKRKLKYIKFSYTGFADEHILTDFITSLAPSLHMQSGDLQAYFDSHWTRNIYKSERPYLKSLFHLECRLCPLCVQENGYYLADWDFVLTTHCQKHNCYLIDTCPSCQKNITWNGAYLSKCHECNEEYSNYPATKLPPNSPLALLANLIKSNRFHNIEKIVLVCNRVYRLGDNLLAQIHFYKMPLSELIPLLSKATAFLYSQRYRDEYLEWLVNSRTEYNAISSTALIEPYRTLTDVLPCHCLKDETDISFKPPRDITAVLVNEIDSPIKTAALLNIRPARLNNVRADLVEVNLQQQIDDERLSELLHIPFASINKLVEEDVLSPVNIIERVRRYFFNLNEIVELLKPNLLVDDGTTRFTRFEELINCEKLKAFVLPRHTLIELTLRKKITLFENKLEVSFSDQFIEEGQAFSALHDEMLNQSGNKSVADLATILCTSIENVIGLYDQGHIEIDNFWQRSEQKDRIINAESFGKFLRTYASLNRRCYFSGESIGITKTNFKRQDITPAIIVNESGRLLYLYSASTMSQYKNNKMEYIKLG